MLEHLLNENVLINGGIAVVICLVGVAGIKAATLFTKAVKNGISERIDILITREDEIIKCLNNLSQSGVKQEGLLTNIEFLSKKNNENINNLINSKTL